MTEGTVKFFNETKGFGFIQPADGTNDVFVHATVLERCNVPPLKDGQKVRFETDIDQRSGKTAVSNIELA